MLPIQQPVHVDEHIHSLCFFSSAVASLLNIMLIIYIEGERESFSVCIWEGIYSVFFFRVSLFLFVVLFVTPFIAFCFWVPFRVILSL